MQNQSVLFEKVIIALEYIKLVQYSSTNQQIH